MTEYLLDSNSLIDAAEKWYDNNVFPSLWTKIGNAPNITITSHVFDEVKGSYKISPWLDSYYKNKQITPNQAILSEYVKIMQWISTCGLWRDAGIAKWGDPTKADPFLIATAKVKGQTIVTMDGITSSLPATTNPTNNEPKICPVAQHFNVPTITLYDVLKIEQFSF